MDDKNNTQINANRKADERGFLHTEISYALRGCIYDIRNNYGPGHKESVYTNLLIEVLKIKNIVTEKEKSINIYSDATGKKVGTYRPDLLVADAILVEVKSSKFTSKTNEIQLYHYLRNSKYEVGYLVNFSSPRLYIKRIVYGNHRKPFLKSR